MSFPKSLGKPGHQAGQAADHQACKTETPVLIQGEPGVGKDLVSKIIHSNSSRANKPLVSLNCSALSEKDLEQELFREAQGHKNVFQRAQGGTLFLRGGRCPAAQLPGQASEQTKKTSSVRRAPVNEIIQEVRLLTSTEKELERLIRKKLFREDLYYQLNVIHIYLPPLRKRIKDFPLLTEHFTTRISSR